MLKILQNCTANNWNLIEVPDSYISPVVEKEQKCLLLAY